MHKREVALVLLILLIVFGTFALYFTFSYSVCQGYACFESAMARCSFATYVNDESEASWHYRIAGRNGDHCTVEVTLLQVKSGDVDLRAFEGDSMLCSYPAGIATYPERDISQCHGLLKEDLQELVIKRLHAYILDTIGEISSEIESQIP